MCVIGYIIEGLPKKSDERARHSHHPSCQSGRFDQIDREREGEGEEKKYPISSRLVDLLPHSSQAQIKTGSIEINLPVIGRLVRDNIFIFFMKIILFEKKIKRKIQKKV